MTVAIMTGMNVPSAFKQRANSLEKEVLEPGRAFVRMKIELRAMQSKKVGDVVSAGTYTFKYKASIGTWAATIGRRDLVKNFVDV